MRMILTAELLGMPMSGAVRWIVILVSCCLISVAQGQDRAGSDGEQVGRAGGGHTVTPVNQILTPLGAQIDLPGMRPQALAESPDGKLLVVSGKTSALVVLDPVSGQVRYQVSLPSETTRTPPESPVSDNILEPDTKGQVSYTGLVFRQPDVGYI